MIMCHYAVYFEGNLMRPHPHIHFYVESRKNAKKIPPNHSTFTAGKGSSDDPGGR